MKTSTSGVFRALLSAVTAVALTAALSAPVLADGIGKTVAVVTQLFGGTPPSNSGTANQVLATNGSGSLFWTTGGGSTSFPLLAPNGSSSATSYSSSSDAKAGVFFTNGTSADRNTLIQGGGTGTGGQIEIDSGSAAFRGDITIQAGSSSTQSGLVTINCGNPTGTNQSGFGMTIQSTGCTGSGQGGVISFGLAKPGAGGVTVHNATPAFNMNTPALSTGIFSFSPANASSARLGDASLGFSGLYLDFTNTGTVGNVTISKPSGRVNLGAGGSTLTVTNTLVTANSHIFLNAASAPGNAVAVQLFAVPSAGSFTVNAVPAITNQTAIDFVLFGAD